MPKIVTELGADVNELDEEGHTPLDYCTRIAHTWQFKTGQHHPRVAACLRDRERNLAICLGSGHGPEVEGPLVPSPFGADGMPWAL